MNVTIITTAPRDVTVSWQRPVNTHGDITHYSLVVAEVSNRTDCQELVVVCCDNSTVSNQQVVGGHRL
jgi:hypothetical protein